LRILPDLAGLFLRFADFAIAGFLPANWPTTDAGAEPASEQFDLVPKLRFCEPTSRNAVSLLGAVL
jgi:hypothetical protein